VSEEQDERAFYVTIRFKQIFQRNFNGIFSTWIVASLTLSGIVLTRVPTYGEHTVYTGSVPVRHHGCPTGAPLQLLCTTTAPQQLPCSAPLLLPCSVALLPCSAPSHHDSAPVLYLPNWVVAPN
jgi:hypothetical protein